MKKQRIRPLPSLIVTCTFACAFAACGGPKLATLAPGVSGDAGAVGEQAGAASSAQTGAPSDEAGAAGSAANSDAGSGGSAASGAGDGGSHG